MKQFIIILFFLSVISVVTGFFLKGNDPKLGELLIGLGVSGAFFVVMPLFLYHRRNRRDVKEYMLTKDSFKKMREFEDSKSRKKNEDKKEED